MNNPQRMGRNGWTRFIERGEQYLQTISGETKEMGTRHTTILEMKCAVDEAQIPIFSSRPSTVRPPLPSPPLGPRVTYGGRQSPPIFQRATSDRPRHRLIKVLVPLMRMTSPSGVNEVLIRVSSEPASGSVITKEATVTSARGCQKPRAPVPHPLHHRRYPVLRESRRSEKAFKLCILADLIR